MNYKIIKKIHYYVFICSVFIVSCKNDKKEIEDTKVSVESENVFNSDEFDFVLPQPISLAKAFQASGLSYHSNLTNPVENNKKYLDKVKQLLNLGLFSTDLAYSAINEHAEEAREYLKVIKHLGNQVGLKPIFSEKSLIDKFDKNLNNMEAVEELIYEIQEKSEEYMQDNDLRYLSIVQFSGAWIEGMYLGINDIKIKKETSNEMKITVVDQMNLLKNIIKGLSTYPNSDNTLNKVSESLSNILSTYNQFESVKKSAEKKNFESPILSEDEFNKLSSMIIELRTFIVK